MHFRSVIATTVLTTVALIMSGCGKGGKGDLSTPKNAAKTYLAAIANGDGEMIKTACTGVDLDWIDKAARMNVAVKKLRDAAISKFGDDGKRLGNDTDAFGKPVEWAKEIHDSEETINGILATLTRKGSPPLKLRKVDDDWKIDYSQMPPGVDGSTLDKIANAAIEVTDDINSGKCKSVAEAHENMEQKIFSASVH